MRNVVVAGMTDQNAGHSAIREAIAVTFENAGYAGSARLDRTCHAAADAVLALRPVDHYPSGIGVSNALAGQRHCMADGEDWPCAAERARHGESPAPSLSAAVPTDGEPRSVLARGSSDFSTGGTQS